MAATKARELPTNPLHAPRYRPRDGVRHDTLWAAALRLSASHRRVTFEAVGDRATVRVA